MTLSRLGLAASTAALFLLPTLALAAPQVVVSIKPIHSLVAAVMQGVGEPSLIVEGAASPHTYSLKPSNAKALQQADVVFWTGPGLEVFLAKPLEALAGKATITELDKAPGVETLKFRVGGPFEADDDGDQDTPGGIDPHIWLNPMNAKAMVGEIERVLVAADPENAMHYQENGAVLIKSLDALDKEIVAKLAPVKDKPFVVFHDAYQYFEHRYGVAVAGSVVVEPEAMPGAERISEIHAKIEKLGATCIFAEPEFESKLIKVVIEGTQTKTGVLDPLGAALKDGPELYPELIRNLATSLSDCLSK
ncbi:MULTISPECIES: zinc ABC transporter substrate-binding protein [Alphaproteobacteria]|uniref:High-affinity zinc uptake system protein ZnuA n=2 Tax=Alphaproteobacteria TaxID=28211 RepID=A0A512HHN3_9HYPH|nr:MULTISPECIES: zinc ABC transporter substrate-binding protein [Alphaproteobacteria]GEO84958.1 zinc ABC transporter substrate-binding protein [Ciceribacter naphthalenivorans]GLR22892.1 zinc ABC transporter substrate-binding protein [Ciceribacter naphthalenivorans]GLT05748.1 zinc ABC transporter substrate-binding protein [Sphingomonas psychrolutea]